MIVEYNRELQYDPDDIDVRLQHFSLGHIIQMIEDRKLAIYDNDMQNLTVSWTKKQKSLFIESLLIKLPIPLFYFDGSYSQWMVIDGLQRLSAISEFIQNKFKLNSLEYLRNECENRFFRELPGYLQARIFETKIVAYVINPGTPREVKYNIFRRINETGTHLNKQEIRHIFFHGQASDFIKSLASTSLFQELSKTRLAAKRMEDREYANRFVSFLYMKNAYDGGMDEFLYKGMEVLSSFQEEQLAHTKNTFFKALERLVQLFGEHLFKMPLPDKIWSQKWNKAIYDMCMYNILTLNEQQMQILLDRKDGFQHEFRDKFSKGGEWHSYIIGSPDSFQAVTNRFDSLKYLLSKYSKL